MKVSNTVMHMHLGQLEKVIQCKGLLGYAIARNYRKIQEAVQDYLNVYSAALEQFGDTVEVETPNGMTQTLSIQPDSPNFEAFMQEIEPIAHIELDVDILQVPYSAAMDQLTAEQMLQLEWMLKEDEDEQPGISE